MRHLTIVYTINNEDEFAPELDRINGLLSPSKGKPWAITAMSLDHEIQRVADIHEAADSYDMDEIISILERSDNV